MSKEKEATPSKELYSRLMDQSAPKSELEWYASRIIRDCMKAMPFGNVNTHTPENLADRIRDLAVALAQETQVTEKLEAEKDKILKEFNAAINFALSTEEGLTFLKIWREGGYDQIDREWPEFKQAFAKFGQVKPC